MIYIQGFNMQEVQSVFKFCHFNSKIINQKEENI